MAIELKRRFLEDEIQEYATENSIDLDDAFMEWFYRLLFDLDETDLIPEDEMVDGSGERQIDIFSIEIDDSDQTSTIHLIQVKSSKGFSANVVSLMKAALDFIFQVPKQQIEQLANQRFRQKILEVRENIRAYGNNNVSVYCKFVTLGDDTDISEEAKENQKLILQQFGESSVFNDFRFDFVGVHELDRIVNLRRNRVRKISYDLPIVYDANRASIVEFDSAGVRSLLCTVSGFELAQLAQLEPRDAVFDANVRGNLGLGGRVNKSIYESSTNTEKAKLFWFMNNGITMVCDSFNIVRDPDAPMVKIQNLQIINGCQTTSSIRAAFENDELCSEVKIQLKLYESKDRVFVDNVVVATNNQNAIGTRDLYANDEIQILIQRRIEEDFDLYYERKRGEAKSANVPPARVIDLEKAGQAYIAIFKRQPTVSRAQKYKVFSKEYYSDVFEKGKPWQLAVAHELYKFSVNRGRQLSKELEPDNPMRNILNYGVFHITRVLWWVLENRSKLDTGSPKELINKIRSNNPEALTAYENAVSIITDVVKENNDSFVNLNNYFKKATSQQNINAHLSSIMEQERMSPE